MTQLSVSDKKTPLVDKIKPEKTDQPKKISWFKVFQVFLIILLFGLVAMMFLHNATALNQDLGRHLKIGQIIWETKSIPAANLFSYTNPNFPFVNHHWLSEVIYYGLYLIVGIKGLVVFSAALAVLSFILIFSLAYKNKFFLFSLLAALLSLGFLFERTDVRPEIFGFLFLALFIFILNKNQEKIKKSILWLLPIQLLWVNTHITFGYGLAIFFFFFVDRLWARRKQIYLAAQKRKIDGYIFKVILVGLSLGAVCLLNPRGWLGAIWPLFVFGNYGYTIVENQSPFFLETMMQNPTIAVFKLMLAVLAVGFLLNFKKTRLFYFLSVLLFTILSWSMIRNFPLLGLAALPFITGSYSQAREDLAKYLWWWNKSKLKVWLRLAVVLLLIFILTGGIYGFVSNKIYEKLSKDYRFGLAIPNEFSLAVDFVKENGLAGPMFNNFDVGGYLIWRLYPAQKVFVDNRPDAFPANFFQSIYIPMQQDEKTWKHYSNEVYKFNYIFFAHTDGTPWARQFLKIISADKDWSLVYLNSGVAIWLRNNQQNQPLIANYELTKEKLTANADNILSGKDFFALAHLGGFFNDSGLTDLAIAAYEKALQINSGSKETAYTIGALYINQGNKEKAIDFFKKALNIDRQFVAAYVALGQVYYMQADFSLAREAWQKALDIDQGNQVAKSYLDNMGLIPFVK